MNDGKPRMWLRKDLRDHEAASKTGAKAVAQMALSACGQPINQLGLMAPVIFHGVRGHWIGPYLLARALLKNLRTDLFLEKTCSFSDIGFSTCLS